MAEQNPTAALIPDLVSKAAALRIESVPEDVRLHAVRTVADTIGVILGGGKRSEVRKFMRGDEKLFPPLRGGSSRFLTAGFPSADPETAAFVNATAGTFLELDEGCRPTGHPAMHVVPAALAAAQALRASGGEFLAAVLGGYEATARLFETFRLRYPLHPHGHFGAVGAAVAVARLRGEDPRGPAAVAATLPLLPVWQACFDGATARQAYTGTASALGIKANRLSSAGFTGSWNSFAVAFGELVGEVLDPAPLEREIDSKTLAITRNYLKLHSACALSHSALDAVFALNPPPAEKVVAVEVETISNNMKIARQAGPNDLSTRFSLPYAVAAALVHGHTGPAAFVPDERVTRLARRVEVRTARDLEDEWPLASPARVTIRLVDEEKSSRVDNPRGHYSHPALPKELAAKFCSLAEVEDPAGLYERLLSIEGLDDMSLLFEGWD